MILEMICEMKKVFLVVVVFLCFVNVSAQNPYPPTIWKRKLIFVSVRTSWYDASHYCHSNHSGLMDDTSEATKEMIKFYKDSDLHWKPHDFNSDYWFGMYLTDPHTLEYIWEGSCEIINATLFERFKDGIPVDASDLDITKRCGFAQKGDSKWDWDDCALANTFTSVCQENTGPCFFERDTHQGACTKGSDESWIVTTTTRDECEEYCRQMMARSVEKGECWAVTYIDSSQTCLPSVHEEPLRFEASTGEYHVSCSENLVTDRGLDSFVSWKRCYDEPEVVGSIPSANEDAPTCFPFTTTTTTTATATETSTTTTATSTIPTTSTATSTTTLLPTTTSTSTVPPTTTSTSTVPPTTTSTSTVPPTTTSTSTVPPTTTSTSTVPPTTTSTSTVPPTTTSTSTVPPTTTSTSTIPPTTTPTSTVPPTTTSTSTVPPTTTSTSTVPPTTTSTSTVPPTTTSTSTVPPTTTSTSTVPPTTTSTSTVPPTTTSTSTVPPTTTSTSTVPPTTTSTSTVPPTTTSTSTIPPTTTTTNIPSTSSNTTAPSATPTTTSSPTITLPIANCHCRCLVISNDTVTIEEKIKELKKQLTVDKKQTSSYIRSVTSATDDRVSATTMGATLGVGILVGVAVLILLADFVTVYRSICDSVKRH